MKAGDRITFVRTLGETASTRRIRRYIGTLEQPDRSDHWWVAYGRGHRRSVPSTDILPYQPGSPTRMLGPQTVRKAKPGHS